MACISSLIGQFKNFDMKAKWIEVLSLGEQQRLAFARLYYHHPAFAILDEATSALDINNESKVYEQLNRLGITYLSVGHRKSLYHYHQKLLTFDGMGSYDVCNITAEDIESLRITKTWNRMEHRTGNMELAALDVDLDDFDIEIIKGGI